MSIATVSSCDVFTFMYAANISRATTIGTMMRTMTAAPRSRYNRPRRKPRIANGSTSRVAGTSSPRTSRQGRAPSTTYERMMRGKVTARYASVTGNAATTAPRVDAVKLWGRATYTKTAPRYASDDRPTLKGTHPHARRLRCASRMCVSEPTIIAPTRNEPLPKTTIAAMHTIRPGDRDNASESWTGSAAEKIPSAQNKARAARSGAAPCDETTAAATAAVVNTMHVKPVKDRGKGVTLQCFRHPHRLLEGRHRNLRDQPRPKPAPPARRTATRPPPMVAMRTAYFFMG